MSSLTQKEIISKADELFTEIENHSEGQSITLDDLREYKLTSNDNELMQLCQRLTNINRFVIQQNTANNQVCFKVRSRTIAAKVSQLKDEKERIIYGHIEEAGTTGIWQRFLKDRTSLHQSVLTKCLKSLENGKYIKQIQSVKNRVQKSFMLYHLTPGEEVTGGSWYSEGELDVELIEKVGEIVTRYVQSHSWREGPRPPRSKRHEAITVEDVHADNTADQAPENQFTNDRGRTLLPYGPDWAHYPPASQILDYINSIGLIQGKDLSLPDVNQLLDMLIYKDKLERIGPQRVEIDEQDDSAPEEMFRSVRQPNGGVFVGNGYSEAPCSRCPVFHLCEENGPISAKTCVYFQEWLEF